MAAMRLANRLVGNDPGAPVLETTLDGVALTFDTEVTVAVTGAVASILLGHGDRPAASDPVAWSLPVYVRAGHTLDVGRAELGVRSYVAVSGGFDVPRVLGSASTDLLSGLGPPPLTAGDLLPIGPPVGPAAVVDVAPYPVPSPRIELAVHPGPRRDWLSGQGLATLASGTWSVSPDSNRIALRLLGPPAQRRRRDELPSEGVILGAIQALPDGQLVAFLADHPTTGGYPVVAVIDGSSLSACAQARPGTSVSLRHIPDLGRRAQPTTSLP